MPSSFSSRHWLLVYAALIVLSILVVRELSLLPDGKLHVHFLDVGQGDAIFLVSPSGKQILIDGGPDLAVLEHIGRYMPFLDRTIELLVLTHPDADHITGLPEVLRRYEVERVLFSGAQHTSGRYDAFLTHLLEKEIPLIEANPGEDIDLGDGLVLDVIWPMPGVFGTAPKNANDLSVVLRVLYGDTAILLPGDIEEEAEIAILASGVDLESTILKVPHHGSRTSSSTGFLLAVDPEFAIISAGRDNQFGHPHSDVLDRYKRLGISVRTTVEEGVISLIFP